jgi:hypothetical protein
VNGAGNIMLDKLGNLGANKICAVLGRDEHACWMLFKMTKTFFGETQLEKLP